MNLIRKKIIVGYLSIFMLMCCTTNTLAQNSQDDFDETYMRYQAKRQVQGTSSKNKQKEKLNAAKNKNKELQKELKQAENQIKSLEKELQKTKKNLDSCSNDLADVTYSDRKGNNKLQPGKNTYSEDDYDDYDDYDDADEYYAETTSNQVDETEQMVEIRALEKRLQERKELQKQQLDILKELQQQLAAMNNNY